MGGFGRLYNNGGGSTNQEKGPLMCLLAILHRVAGDVPLLIGANREEFYDRGGDPPRLLEGVRAVAGVDPLHGGTWLGVNAAGVVIAVTNRRKTRVIEDPRSRGLLARELLACGSAKEAVDAAAALETNRYAGCNFLCADGRVAVVVQAGDWLRVRPLPAGVHVLSNADVNDPTDRRVVHAMTWLAGQRLATSAEAIVTLQGLCGSREVCFRAPHRGTVSSSVLAVPGRVADGLYLHSQGPPNVTPYADLSALLRELG